MTKLDFELFLGEMWKKICRRKKILLVGGALILAVVLLTVGMIPLRYAELSENYVLYLKNEDLYLADCDGSRVRLSGDIFRPFIWSEYTAVSFSEEYGDLIAVRDGGNRIFFPGRIGSRFSILYKDLDRPLQAPKKAAPMTWDYAVSMDGSKMLYVDDRGRLVWFDMEEKKVSSIGGAYDFYADEELNVVLADVWADGENHLTSGDWDAERVLYWFIGEERETLTLGVGFHTQCTENLRCVYVLQDGNLRRVAAGEEPEQIAQNVLKMEAPTQTGELYYWSGDRESYPMTLSYYNGVASAELLTTAREGSFAEDACVGVVRTEYAWEEQWYLIVEDRVIALEYENIQDVEVSKDGSTVAFVDETALYTIKIQNGVPEQPVCMESGVKIEELRFLPNGSVCYFKDISNEGALFVDGVQVDTDVLAQKWQSSDGWVNPLPGIAVDFCEETQMLFYYDGWNMEKGAGTLNAWNGETSTVIDREVTDYYVDDSGNVYYLKNKNRRKGTADLYVYREGVSLRIDQNVTCIVSNGHQRELCRGG